GRTRRFARFSSTTRADSWRSCRRQRRRVGAELAPPSATAHPLGRSKLLPAGRCAGGSKLLPDATHNSGGSMPASSVWRMWFLVGALGVIGAAAASAQQQPGGIAGLVRDTSGAVLPGVSVEASSPALIERARTV